MVICHSDYRHCEIPWKYQRKEPVNRRDQWSEETQQEAVKRIKAGELGKREEERYYAIPSKTLCRRTATANFKRVVLARRPLLDKQRKNDWSSIFSD
jgi:hypothetical protein